MAKPDPALLNPARYPFSCPIEPRFGDLDFHMHINNVAMAGMIEDSRVRFYREVGYSDLLAGFTSMVASLEIDYLDEGRYPDGIAVHCAIEELGRSSHRIASLVRQGDRPICFARSTLVTVGPEGPCPLPERFRRAVAEWMLAA